MDDLEQLLRQTDSHLDDGGFTARVLSELPAPRRRSLLWPALAIAGLTLTAAAVTPTLLPILSRLMGILAQPGLGLGSIGLAVVAGTVILTIGALQSEAQD